MKSWEERQPFNEGLKDLLDKAKQKPRTDRPALVPRDEIRTAHSFFQPRLSDKDEAHIRELERAIKAKPAGQQHLDPILVMMIGRSIYCVDGHNRLIAYRRAGVDGVIPVEWYEGSIEDAYAEACQRNGKDRLPMTMEEKMEAAWNLVWLGKLTRLQIAEKTGVSPRTVDNMRATLKKLRERDQATPGVDYWLSWREAKRGLRGDEHKEFTDEMRSAQAREWARRFAKAFGRQAAKNPDILAEAIEMHNSGLPKALVDVWIDLAEAVVDEWRDSPF